MFRELQRVTENYVHGIKFGELQRITFRELHSELPSEINITFISFLGKKEISSVHTEQEDISNL